MKSIKIDYISVVPTVPLEDLMECFKDCIRLSIQEQRPVSLLHKNKRTTIDYQDILNCFKEVGMVNNNEQML